MHTAYSSDIRPSCCCCLWFVSLVSPLPADVNAATLKMVDILSLCNALSFLNSSRCSCCFSMLFSTYVIIIIACTFFIFFVLKTFPKRHRKSDQNFSIKIVCLTNWRSDQSIDFSWTNYYLFHYHAKMYSMFMTIIGVKHFWNTLFHLVPFTKWRAK